MKILSVAGSPYEDYEGQILHLHVSLDPGETIHLHEAISIELMDGSFLEREVMVINPKYIGDFGTISNKVTSGVDSGKYGKSKDPVMIVSGPCSADLVVTDVPCHEVKSDEEIAVRKAIEEKQNMICLSPYKELSAGELSIYDHVQPGYTVPSKVIAYLKTTNPYSVCAGIYKHPFKPDMELLGPYMYTDGKHYWDRDLWKYAVKYHVTLPEGFVDYVMSGAGDNFLGCFKENPDSWQNRITEWKNQPGSLCLLPDDAGDIELKGF